MAIYKTLVKKVSIPPDKKTKQKQYEVEGKLAIIDQGQKLIGGYSDDQTMKLECSLPVIVFGYHTCTVKYIDFPFGAGADGIKVLEPSELTIPKYLYYGTQYLTLRFPDKGYARHYQHIEKMDLTVPPLTEQERIVTRIEELFSSLDNAVETLKKTKEQLAVYRQAVLYSAFVGLTQAVPMGNIASMTDPQPSHRTPPEIIGGIPYIGVGDIDYSKKQIKLNEARKVSPSVLEEHLARYTLQDGDFIMGKIGTIGKPYKVHPPQNYALSANVILIQPDANKIDPDFLFWQFSSPIVTKQLTEGATATSQPAFGITKARLLSIRLCDMKQQKEIVQEIESRLSVCESIVQTVDTALAQADAMRQSILKQAFEGGF